MPYDPDQLYNIPFVGGPCDGKTYPLRPADRLVWDQAAPNGVVVKRHVYDLRMGVNPTTGDVEKLAYEYSS